MKEIENLLEKSGTGFIKGVFGMNQTYDHLHFLGNKKDVWVDDNSDLLKAVFEVNGSVAALLNLQLTSGAFSGDILPMLEGVGVISVIPLSDGKTVELEISSFGNEGYMLELTFSGPNYNFGKFKAFFTADRFIKHIEEKFLKYESLISKFIDPVQV